MFRAGVYLYICIVVCNDLIVVMLNVEWSKWDGNSEFWLSAETETMRTQHMENCNVMPDPINLIGKEIHMLIVAAADAFTQQLYSQS